MVVIQENIPIAPYTTFNVGGLARYFSVAKTQKDIFYLIKWAQEKNLPVFILGGGSNILVSDEGFKGLVIKNEFRYTIVNQTDSRAVCRVGSGVVWQTFVYRMVKQGYEGLECLAGIPGTVGGVPIQNVGAYGQEAKNIVSTVRAINIITGEMKTFSKEECCFEYRTSIFKNNSVCFIVDVTFTLKKSENPPEELLRIMVETINTRKTKSTIYNKNDPDSISAGSFFTNPIISEKAFTKLLTLYKDIPFWNLGNQKYKISAGWLIERSGYNKGYQQGNAGLSSKHALIIVNKGNAKSVEIRELSRNIQESVFNKFEVQLQPEPVFIGD